MNYKFRLRIIIDKLKNTRENQKYSKAKKAKTPFLSQVDCGNSLVSSKGCMQYSVLFNSMCRREKLWRLDFMSSGAQIIFCFS